MLASLPRALLLLALSALPAVFGAQEATQAYRIGVLSHVSPPPSHAGPVYSEPAVNDTFFETPDFAQSGGLASYGPELAHGAERGAVFVDKILQGADPAELPVEQPSRYELWINMATARGNGIEIPPSVMVRATRLVE